MVIFRSADGKPGYHQAETLEEAVSFVEKLRNEEHVTDARVFRMDEVAIEFKVYYRVAVTGDAPVPPLVDAPEPAVTGAADDAPVGPTAEGETPAEATDGEGADDGAANGSGNPGRFGLFSRA